MSLGERTKRVEVSRLPGGKRNQPGNREEALGHSQKSSLMRYKAFANTGGGSFSLGYPGSQRGRCCLEQHLWTGRITGLC